MTRRVASLYYPGYQTQVLLDDHWTVMTGFKNWQLLWRSKKSEAKITLFTKTLPLNRFSIIRSANKKLTNWLLRSRLGRQKMPELLWIGDPEYFDLHNYVPSKYIVFSCEESCLADPVRYIRYREYFEAGWVFGYQVADDCQFWVFKKTAEAEIVKKLLRKRR